jgi:hypothetical protein
VDSRHPEERMPNLHVVIGDSFKDHTVFPIAAFVQPLPSKRAILSSPMHAIDATKHPRKSQGFGLSLLNLVVADKLGQNIATTARQNLKTLSVNVDSAMRRLSTAVSGGAPYAMHHRAAVHF